MVWVAALILVCLLIYSTLRLGINLGRLGFSQILASKATPHLSLLFLILGLIAPSGALILSFSPEDFVQSVLTWVAEEYLARDGHELASLFKVYGTKLPWVALVAGWIFGYLTKGKHREFNRMRQRYEAYAGAYGYWFCSPWPDDVLERDANLLDEIEDTYSRLLDQVDAPEVSVDAAEEQHQTMILFYQRALLRASRRDYSGALEDVRSARSVNGANSQDFSKEYAETAESEQMFLEAELLLATHSGLDLARELLLKAREIDEKNYDAAGLEQINDRLAKLDDIEGRSSPITKREG